MKALNNLKIGTKLMGGFIILAVLLVLVAAVGFVNMKNINDGMLSMYNQNLIPIEKLGAANNAILMIRGNIIKALLLQQNTDLEKEMAQQTALVNQNMDEFRKANPSEEEKETLQKFETGWKSYQGFINPIVSNAIAGDWTAAKKIVADPNAVIAREQTENALTKLVELNKKDGEQSYLLGNLVFIQSVWVISIAGGLALFLAILMGIILTRSITGPLSKSVEMMQELGQGHLSKRLKIVRDDEIGVLANAIDKFTDDLQFLVVGTLKKMSVGDLSSRFTAKDDQDEIMPAINGTLDSLRGLVLEANQLSQAAVEGKLSARGDAASYEGSYREIIQGVNNTLDAVIGPLNVAAAYVDQISKGEIPEKITESYHGDFNLIKNNINNMLVYLEEMSKAAGQIAEGDLSAQVNARSKKDVLGNAFINMIEYINGMAEAASQIADNDLSVEIKPKSDQDELGQTFVKMVNGLNSTISQTNAVTNQVVQAIEQVRSVSQDLASNAQEQSSAVEEVASSVEETDSQVKASADHANVANQLASQTTSLANVGQEKMKLLSQSMNSIANSSLEISKIIKVIDEIAFQTNLLALNAAVEAARAGQYGKGFAVVAQEVRNLAERSAKAAKSTAELIEDSSRRVQEGVDMTDETASSLNEIVQNVVKVKDLVGEIAAASEEQTKALNQISQAITQVSQGTQSNSSQSEELASTADELGSLADRLHEEVNRFKLRQIQEGMAAGLPVGVTPEMLQAVLASIQKSALIPSGKKPGKNAFVDGIKDVNLDERGYANF